MEDISTQYLKKIIIVVSTDIGAAVPDRNLQHDHGKCGVPENVVKVAYCGVMSTQIIS